MDGFRDVGGHVERYLIRQPVGEIPADFIHGLFHAFCHVHGIGTRQHVNAEHGSVAAVDAAFRVVGLCFERDARHIAQADERTVGVGAQHDFFKLADGGQAAFGGDGDGDVQSFDGLLAEHSRRRFPVLVFQGVLQVLDGQSEVGQLVGLHPNLHGVIAAADVGHAPHAGDAAQHVHHVDGGEVAEVNLVKLGVVRREADGHQLAGRLLLHGDAVLDDFGRQAGFGQFHTVLDFHGGQVRVGRDVERHGGRESAGVGAAGLHVEHARCAIQLLFDGGGHGLRHGECARARIRCADLDHGWRDLRILVDGQQGKPDETDNDDEYGNDRRKHRAVDEISHFHGCSYCLLDVLPLVFSPSSTGLPTRTCIPGLSL